MQPETPKLLRDMLDHATDIQWATAGFNLEMFDRVDVVRKAVQWDFAVIGEAMNRLRQIDEDAARRITSWRRIIDFRNQLIHGYDIIRNSITWNIVTVHLPVLIEELELLLSEDETFEKKSDDGSS